MADASSFSTVRTVLETARHCFSQGQMDDAYAHLQRILDDNPDSGRAWEMLGLVYHARQQWEPALRALEKASVYIPLQPMAQCALADSYLACGRGDWAREFYEDLLHREDLTSGVLLNTAAGLNLLGDPWAAVAACRKAIGLEPYEAQPYFSLSFYLGRTGAPERLIESTARHAIDLAPENLTFRVGLAGYLHVRGRTSETEALLAAVTQDDIESLNCQCCLERLRAIFEALGDHSRVHLCGERATIIGRSREDSAS